MIQNINRQKALSYAKDLVAVFAVPPTLMFGCAECMREYMDGEMVVDVTPFRLWLKTTQTATKPKV